MWICAAVSLSLNENSANEVAKTHRTIEETPVHTSDVNSCVFHVCAANSLEKCSKFLLQVCLCAHQPTARPHVATFPVVPRYHRAIRTFPSVTALKKNCAPFIL